MSSVGDVHGGRPDWPLFDFYFTFRFTGISFRNYSKCRQVDGFYHEGFELITRTGNAMITPIKNPPMCAHHATPPVVEAELKDPNPLKN